MRLTVRQHAMQCRSSRAGQVAHTRWRPPAAGAGRGSRKGMDVARRGCGRGCGRGRGAGEMRRGAARRSEARVGSAKVAQGRMRRCTHPSRALWCSTVRTVRTVRHARAYMRIRIRIRSTGQQRLARYEVAGNTSRACPGSRSTHPLLPTACVRCSSPCACGRRRRRRTQLPAAGRRGQPAAHARQVPAAGCCLPAAASRRARRAA